MGSNGEKRRVLVAWRSTELGEPSQGNGPDGTFDHMQQVKSYKEGALFDTEHVLFFRNPNSACGGPMCPLLLLLNSSKAPNL